MRTIEARVAGEPCKGYVATSERDLRAFMEWVDERARRGEVVACDTETTGLHVFSPGFRVRLVQFGTAREGWLIPVEWQGPFWDAVRSALFKLPKLTFHNFPYDGLALDHVGLADLFDLAPKVRDTKIYAHLIDSRPPEDGGTGTALKPLLVEHVDPKADDGQSELTRLFNSLGHTKVTGWAEVDILHPTYLFYALWDVLGGARLLPVLEGICEEMRVPRPLIEYEHRLALIGAKIQRKGMLIDVQYTERLVDELHAEKEKFAEVARGYGVEKVNSPRQVADALVGMGELLTERTASGQLAVGKEVLMVLADLDRKWERIGARKPNVLADAVLRSKRAGKWASSYAQAMLDLRDRSDRIHPHTNTMGARTARWSVSNPPLQQLPSSDWRIRRCVVASPGNVIVASDFRQVELRVLAGLAGASEICERVNAGEDLHSLTTRLVFGIGPEVTDKELEDDPRRKLCKTISLGKAYAGGVRTLARQTGLPVEQVKRAVAQYDRALPAIKRFGKALTNDAFRNGMSVRTPSGRLLRLSRDKAYTAIAYLCQSTARDILGQALLDMEDSGLLTYVIGVVHDEVIADVPASEAEEIKRAMGDAMTFKNAFGMVDITADPQIYGDNWGMGYKGPARFERAA